MPWSARRGGGRRRSRYRRRSADPGENGYYYEPTVLTDCRQEMEIMRSEIFGPVVPIVTFGDIDEAIGVRQRFRLRPHLFHLHPRSERGPAGPARRSLRRNLYQSRELRGHAGLPCRLAQERHRRRRRQARTLRVHPNPCRLHPELTGLPPFVQEPPESHLEALSRQRR